MSLLERTTVKQTLATGLALLSGLAQAHTGHGLPGSAHWHASDALLFLGAAVAAAAGFWLNRRK